MSVAVGACGGDSDTPATKTTRARVTTTVDAAAAFITTPAASDVTATGTAAPLDPTVEKELLNHLRDYIDTAMWRPLRGETAAADLDQLLGADVVAYLGTHVEDRNVLSDEGSGFEASRGKATIRLHALLAPDGTVSVIVGAFDATASGSGTKVHRTGELLFEARNDKWGVVGYDVTVARDPGAGAAVTTTTAATP